MRFNIPPERRARPFFAAPLEVKATVPQVRWADAVLCSIDCETTGTDTGTDRIWEWGAYWWGGSYHGTGESRICNPERDLDEKLAKKMAVTPQLWAEVRAARLFAEQSPELEATMSAVRRLGAVLVGWYLTGFDLEIIRSELHRARRSMVGWGLWTEGHRPTSCLDDLPVIDGLALASWWRPELTSLSLGKVATALGHPVPEGLHRTGVDAPLALHITRMLVEARMPAATLSAVIQASDQAVKARVEDRARFGGYFARAHDGTLWCRWGQAGKRLENLSSKFIGMLLHRDDLPEAGKRRLRDELRGRG